MEEGHVEGIWKALESTVDEYDQNTLYRCIKFYVKKLGVEQFREITNMVAALHTCIHRHADTYTLTNTGLTEEVGGHSKPGRPGPKAIPWE